MIELVRDKKGDAWVLGHKRCGYHECIFLTDAELVLLRECLDSILNKEI